MASPGVASTAVHTTPVVSTLIPYKTLIEEAYLSPIRSAIIVDDSFPTLDLLLNDNDEKVKAQLNKDRAKLLELITACRSKGKAWLVDVHNGEGLEVYAAANEHFHRLHQSDLMILDYHLDGTEGGNVKVSNILRSLSESKYFNLAIIYTKCTDTELLQRFLDIAQSLVFKDPEYELSNPLPPPESLQEWEDESDGITAQLLEALKLELFLKLFQEKDATLWPLLIQGTQLAALFQLKNTPSEDLLIPVTRWLLSKKYRTFVSAMSPIDLGKIEFNINDPNWIRTETLFLTVIGKEIEPAELTDKLLEALHNSNPSPHRLLMTKIRNVLDESGISAEKNILEKKFLQAGWLNEILSSSEENEQNWKLNRAINHHWEELANQVSHEVRDYAKNLILAAMSDHSNNTEDLIKNFTSVIIPDQLSTVMQEWNSYICSKPVDGHHLMTGHILYIQATDEYWLCLSPICDLAPRPGNQKWGGKKIPECNLIPFKAVKLQALTADNDKKSALKNIAGGEYILIGSGNALRYFKIADNPSAKPIWNQFFAHQNGKFGTAQELQISSIAFAMSTRKKLKTLRQEHNAKLVMQLRYEYALNLLNRLGGTFSRVGLEFSPYPLK